MNLPYTKAHGAKNDFLLTWAAQASGVDLEAAAIAICDRHTGIGADGWLIVSPEKTSDYDARIRLFNSDGGEVEISGNGTRCAAALLTDAMHGSDSLRIATGAGVKSLRLLHREGNAFFFEMNMGHTRCVSPRFQLPLSDGVREVTLMNVGNPQCVVFVDDFSFNWRRMGAEIESHEQFPGRTNVSFVRVVDGHTIDVRFWERGAGETMSSGTGSTGAAAAAVERDLIAGPVVVQTAAGPLALSWREDGIHLQGPAELVGSGVFYFSSSEVNA